MRRARPRRWDFVAEFDACVRREARYGRHTLGPLAALLTLTASFTIALATLGAGLVPVANAGVPLVCKPPPAGLVLVARGRRCHGHRGESRRHFTNGAGFAAWHRGPGILYLDGVDDYVRVPDRRAWTLGRDAFTIDAWVNFAQPAGTWCGDTSATTRVPDLLAEGNPASGSSGLTTLAMRTLRETRFGFHINSPAFGPVDTVAAFWTPQLNHWYHVAVTRLVQQVPTLRRWRQGRCGCRLTPNPQRGCTADDWGGRGRSLLRRNDRRGRDPRSSAVAGSDPADRPRRTGR